jgi:hypothetical protein
LQAPEQQNANAESRALSALPPEALAWPQAEVLPLALPKAA